MCMISIQGMNCGRDNCCHGNSNFRICQVWIYNSAIIRLQWGGVSRPSDPSLWRNPFLHTSLQAPCSHTSGTSRSLRQSGETLDCSARVIFQRGHWGPSWPCTLPGEPIGPCRQDHIWPALPCSRSSLTQVFSNAYQFFGNSRCIFP